MLCSVRAQDPLELFLQNLELSFRPDDIVRELHLLFDRELGAEALLDLRRGPAARLQSLTLRGRRAGDAHRGIEPPGGLGFEEERDDDDGHGFTLLAPNVDLAAPDGMDRRVQNLLQAKPGPSVSEYEVGELVPFEPARSIQKRAAKLGCYLFQRRLARLDDLPGHEIGVDQGDATSLEHVRGGGLPHADATGEAQGSHDIGDRPGGRPQSGDRAHPTVPVTAE